MTQESDPTSQTNSQTIPQSPTNNSQITTSNTPLSSLLIDSLEDPTTPPTPPNLPSIPSPPAISGLTPASNENYSKSMKTKLLLVVVVVVLIISVFAGSFLYFSGFTLRNLGVGGRLTTNNQQLTINKSSIHVPEIGEAEKDGIAVPVSVRETLANSKNKVRTFALSYTNNSFPVKKYYIYEGDVIRFQLSAQESAYDVTIPFMGIKQELKPGDTKAVEFQAVTAGKYKFYCDSCRDKEKTSGEIVVVARE